MADISDLQAALTNKLTGADSSGAETFFVKASANQDLGTSDILNAGGVDAVLALTTSPVLGKVGASPLANRKYFIMEALDNNVKWGFTSTSQSFDLFKSQIIMIPCGDSTQIWFKMSTGTGSVSIGEVA